jgi:hypothetical protein
MSTGKEPFQVSTQRPRHKQATPRLPNERDESDDSQESAVRADIRQAFDDLMAGQQDTDLREQRGVEEVVKAHTETMRKPAPGS